MLTADDLTEELIHEHLEWLRNQPYIGDKQRKAIRRGIENCRQALVPDGQRVVAVWYDARERVAKAINARLLDRCPGRGHQRHVPAVCSGSCCTSCGGPIDSNSECRCWAAA